MMTGTVCLTSEWFIQPGCEARAYTALSTLAQSVCSQEPDTLFYLVHAPLKGTPLVSLPPAVSTSVLFYECYASVEAFQAHLDGPVFTAFVAMHGDLFVQVGGKPYTTVLFLDRMAGFVRGPDTGEDAVAAPAAALPANAHPAVMFEVMANDQAAMCAFYTRIFSWQYRPGGAGFAYVHFPAGSPPLLGGIGQADATIPGLEPGRNFYLLVENVGQTLSAACAAGGQALMPPTEADGYRFAMFRDPEGNPIGLIEPFA